MGQLSRAQDAVVEAIKSGTDVPWEELYATRSLVACRWRCVLWPNAVGVREDVWNCFGYVPYPKDIHEMKRYIASALDEEYGAQRSLIEECRGPDSTPARMMLRWCEDTNARVLGE